MTEPLDPARIVVVSTATGSIAEAHAIAEALVSRRLAACVQIAAIESVYRWDGAVQRAPEHLLQIKTLSACVPQVQDCIAALHTYDLPEILVTPTCGGSDAYLDWVRASVAQ